MKLSRITKIREHRVFRDFSWPSELHPFGQFNLIYGWNGCGKTTLSSLLAHIEKRTPISEGDVEFEFDGSIKVAGSMVGTAVVPQVRVFNRDFINATIQSAGSGITPIYYLGEDNVEKQATIDKLKSDLAAANTEVATATREKRTADLRLDEFCVSTAKLIKELLTSANSIAYNNYDKRRFKLNAQALTADDVADALLSDEEKTRLRTQKDAQPKHAIERVQVPSVDLEELRAGSESIVGQSVVARTLAELAQDTELSSWVQRGLSLHSEIRHSETCRFCSQPLTRSRRAVLEAHFNDAFAAFQRDVAGLLARLKAAKGLLEALRFPEASRFYAHLATEVSESLEIAKERVDAALRFIDALLGCVESKRDNPFAAAIAELPPAAAPNAVGESLAEAVATVNAVIDEHNNTTEDFKRSVEDACNRLERAYVAEAHAEYRHQVDAAARADEDLQNTSQKPGEIQGRIDELERAVVEHRRPADELTDELRAYLGRDELRFEVKETGYALTRDGKPVSHLSEGERTAISFLYFLKSLQDKSFDLTDGIVVIDDPVSSLDANALFSAFAYMKERTKQSGQLFVFTHSFPFFRQVKNWFHHLPKQNSPKGERRPGRFYLLHACPAGDGGARTSRLGPLDPLLEKHESEYHYLFKRVYEEARRTGGGSLERHYGIPNVARRLVETFLAFRFPDATGDLSPRLERVAFDNAKKTRILRLLNTYSHAQSVGEPEHDLSLLTETQPVLLEVLEMMKAVDPVHYAGLESLVTAAEAT